MSHSSIFLISNTSRSLLCISHSSTMQIVTLFCFGTRAHLCVFLLPSTGTRLCSSWWVQVPYTKLQFERFSHSPLGRVNTASFLYLLFTSSINLNIIPPPPSFLTLAVPFFLPLLLLLSPTLLHGQCLFLASSYFLEHLIDYVVPPNSSSPFRYFLPYSAISYGRQPHFFFTCSYFCLFNFLTSLFFLSGYISNSALNTLLLVVREDPIAFLVAAICTVSSCFTDFAVAFPCFSCIF